MAAEHASLNTNRKAPVDEGLSHDNLNGWTHPTWADVPWSTGEE